MTLIQMNVRSWCLNTNTDVAIILPSIKQHYDPKEYYRSGKKYPVLWLLHGTLGCYNDYLRRTNIELYATENDLIVVMPSGGNSNYSNWNNMIPPFRVFDYLTEELMPLIYGWFPASDKREDNYICGLSMGARGSSKYAFNHPDKFAGCACMSGVPSDIDWLLEDPDNPMAAREMITVREAGGIDAYRNSYENVWAKVEEVAKMADPPKFYFCCGTDDGVYPRYLHFKEYAQKIGLKATFDEREGYAHEWRFWELELQEILKFFGFDKTKKPLPDEKSGAIKDSTLV